MNSIFTVSLLIVVMSFQTVGYLIVFKVWTKKNRHDVKMSILNDLSDDLLTIVKIPLNDNGLSTPLIEFEYEDEFKMNGEMYDIVRTEIQNDSIVYFTIHDVKESFLVKWLASAVDQRTRHDDSFLHRTTHLLSIGQLQYLAAPTSPFLLQNFTVPFRIQESSIPIKLPLLPEIPPPKCNLFT